jgi:hypothetical protein
MSMNGHSVWRRGQNISLEYIERNLPAFCIVVATSSWEKDVVGESICDPGSSELRESPNQIIEIITPSR